MSRGIAHAALVIAAGFVFLDRAAAFPNFNGDYDGKTIVTFEEGGRDYKSLVRSGGHAISNFVTQFFQFQILPRRKATGDMQIYMSPNFSGYYSQYDFVASSLPKPDKPKRKKHKRIILQSTGNSVDTPKGSRFALSGMLGESPTAVTGTVERGKKGALDLDLKIKPAKPKKAGFEGPVRVRFIGKLKS
jgi:hypothetical protein